MMICKVHSLCKAFSGIRLETIQRILWMIEKDIIPFVPCKGSVGASGDLAPLSHLFLPLIGLGEVFHKGEKFMVQSANNTKVKGEGRYINFVQNINFQAYDIDGMLDLLNEFRQIMS
jgi:histidine ammonia-lyase